MQTERSQNNALTPETIPEVVYEGSKICNLQLRYAIKLFFATDRTKLLYSWVKQNVIQMGQFKDALDYLIFLDGRNINLWEKN
jgi:uncharacterized pyridoxamine 5'-phosphate oxidase family protein